MTIAICGFFFNHSLNNWLPQILVDGGMDAATAGYWASIPTLVGIFGALAIPRLAVPSRRIALMLMLYVCAGTASLLILTFSGPALGLGLVLQGIARTSMTPIAMLVLMDSRDVDSRTMGAAGGLYFSAGEIGGVLGPLTVGYVADLTGGFTAALYMLTGVSVVLALLTVPLRRRTRY
jgi:cyanate permease